MNASNVKGGVKVLITADTRALEAALGRLGAKGGQTLIDAALKNVGEVLLNATRQRFNQEVSPAGTPWAPLNPLYKGTEADRDPKTGKVGTKGVKRGAKILQESGQLFASLTYQVGDGQLQIGTNKIYAAIHQFGGSISPKSTNDLIFWLGGKLVHAKKVTIPARPFLGLSPADRSAAIEAVAEVARAKWSGTP